MTVYLHIGFPKTATTSIQRFLFDNSEALMERGIYYPLVDTDFKQRYLKSLMTKRDSGNAAGTNIELSKLRELTRLCSEWAGKKIILSCEELTNDDPYDLSAGGLQDFSNFIKKFNEKVCVIGYVRDPVEYYLSRLQEDLKYTYKIKAPFEYKPGYSEILLGYSAHFPNDIIIRKFSRDAFVNGNIIHDFFSNASVDFSNDLKYGTNISVNQSLCPEVMFLLETLHQKVEAALMVNLYVDNRNMLWRFLAQISQKTQGRTRPALFLEAAKIIHDSSRKDYEFLKERFNILFDFRVNNFNCVSAPVSATTRLQQIVAIDYDRVLEIWDKFVGRNLICSRGSKIDTMVRTYVNEFCR